MKHRVKNMYKSLIATEAVKRLCNLRVLVSLSILFSYLTLCAQSEPMLSQWWAVPSFYNPATVGGSEWFSIRGVGRLDWVGIENAPKSIVGVAETPLFNEYKNVGVGVKLMQESLGLFSETGASAQLSWKRKVGRGKLSIGGEVGIRTSKFRGSDVVLPTEQGEAIDGAIPNYDVAGDAVDLGIGISYMHPQFSTGISILHLNRPVISLQKGENEENSVSNYETTYPQMLYFQAEGNIRLPNSLIILYPAMQVVSDFSSLHSSVSLRGSLYPNFQIGLGYRIGESVGAMAQCELGDFLIGYNFDYSLSRLGRASMGCHEIVVGYRMKLNFGGENHNKQKSIRFL